MLRVSKLMSLTGTAASITSLTGMAASMRLLNTTSAALGGKANSAAEAKDDDSFELLPPGCSVADPAYGLNEDDTVLQYDEAVPSATSTRTKKAVPQPPRNVAAAQEKLNKKVDDDEPYVYLPPGSSMREPGYNSMSDPIDKVFYRDPIPTIRKK